MRFYVKTPDSGNLFCEAFKLQQMYWPKSEQEAQFMTGIQNYNRFTYNYTPKGRAWDAMVIYNTALEIQEINYLARSQDPVNIIEFNARRFVDDCMAALDSGDK